MSKTFQFVKKTFRLQGLDCANCAAKMERAIGALDGVRSASVNFMTTKLIIEGEAEKLKGIIEATEKIIRKIEPDVVVKKA
ncbi:MAG: cation transporter [Anaerovoracaceae bacterium]|jgi:copper chaperone CopZ